MTQINKRGLIPPYSELNGLQKLLLAQRGLPATVRTLCEKVQALAMAHPSFTPLSLAAALFFATASLSPLFAADASAKAEASATRSSVQKVSLKTGLANGKMVYFDEKGNANPMLHARVGDTIELVLASGEGAEHDIVFEGMGIASKKTNGQTGPVKVTFKVTQPGKFTYYCSVPGHRQIGMEGILEVTGPTPAKAAKASTEQAVALYSAAPTSVAIAPAAAEAVSVAQDPNAVPKPLGTRAPQFVKYSIETVEVDGKLDDGTTFTYWTFNRKVPGPMLRVKQGDTVELTLSNNPSSKAIHSIDLHAVTGGLGGGADTQVPPGKSKTITFKALNPGLYVYHCATASVAHHISAGMYGLILVEPPEGLPKVDKEFYVMQGDLYTGHRAGTKGHHEYSPDRAADENPSFYLFNGAVGALTKEYKLTATAGDTVRIYFGVGGPNKISSFHVIGEIFDKVYSEGSTNTIKENVQTTLVAPGGATIVDFKVQVPGTYLLVDHALSRVGKGLVGALEVSGSENHDVYKPQEQGPATMAH